MLAVYTSFRINVHLKTFEPATIKFLVNVPNEEKVFLILTLMFRDFRIPPSIGRSVCSSPVYASHLNGGTDVSGSLSNK